MIPSRCPSKRLRVPLEGKEVIGHRHPIIRSQEIFHEREILEIMCSGDTLRDGRISHTCHLQDWAAAMQQLSGH